MSIIISRQAIENLPPVPQDGKIGHLPAFCLLTDRHIDAIIHDIARPIKHNRKDLVNDLNCAFYAHMPHIVTQRNGTKRVKVGNNLGWWDTAHIHHTPAYLNLPCKPGSKIHERFNSIAEHVVPFNLTYRMFEACDGDKELIRKVLFHYYKLARCTRTENRRLEEKGLRQDMPDGWQIGHDAWARWKACGLVPLAPQENWAFDLDDQQQATLWSR